MAGYQTGNNTKKNILEICKGLFYENGYDNTSFNEICEKAEVNPGSIMYHFKGGKANIAEYIYNEVMITLQNCISELCFREDNTVKMICSYILHMKLFFADEKYRRFSAEYSADHLPHTSVKTYQSNIPIVSDAIFRYMDPLKANFYFSVLAGMDGRIEPFIIEHFDEFTIEKAVKYVCEIYLMYLDNEEIDKKITASFKLMENVDMHNDKFSITVTGK